MSYADSFKDGLSLINRNWQLVLLKGAASLVNCFLLLVFFLAPLVAVLIYMGYDIKGMPDAGELMSLLQNPLNLFNRYMGIFIMVFVCLVLYMAASFSVWVFAFGGALGYIDTAIAAPLPVFRARVFFSEARRLFMPIMGYTAALGLLLIGISLAVGLLIAAAALLGMLMSRSSEMVVIVGAIFLGLFLMLVSIAVSLALVAMTFYGSALVVVRGKGAFESLGDSVRFFRAHPDSLAGFLVMLVCYGAAVFTVAMAGAVLNVIPVFGIVMALPYQLFSYAVYAYFGLLMAAAVMYDIRRKSAIPQADARPVGGTAL